MRHLFAQRFIIRQNTLAIIGVCLFCYFSWHIVMGQRSYVRLLTLEHSVEKLSYRYDRLHEKREDIESRVFRLRPGSIDADLLEERARYVLGYIHPGDHLLLAGYN